MELQKPLKIAVGPVMERPSWAWIGRGIVQELEKLYNVVEFQKTLPSHSDVIIYIKHPPWQDADCPIIYCPVDFFQNEVQIYRYCRILCRCDLVLSHSRRLIPYLQQYTQVEYVDHQLKYILPTVAEYKTSGPILWVGMSDNLPPILTYLCAHKLPEPIHILTDCIPPDDVIQELFAKAKTNNVIDIDCWTPPKQIEWLAKAKATIEYQRFEAFIKTTSRQQNYKHILLRAYH